MVPSELRRRMTMSDYFLLLRYFAEQSDDGKKKMPNKPEDLMRGFQS